MMNDPEFDRLLAEAVAAPFSGWDFSWIEGRRVEEEDTVTTWDYEERARKLVQAADSIHLTLFRSDATTNFITITWHVFIGSPARRSAGT